MRARRGRHNEHTIYLQLGDEPAEQNAPDGDIFIGVTMTGEMAALVTDAINYALAMSRYSAYGNQDLEHHYLAASGRDFGDPHE